MHINRGILDISFSPRLIDSVYIHYRHLGALLVIPAGSRRQCEPIDLGAFVIRSPPQSADK